jgi:hypothetical protein
VDLSQYKELGIWLGAIVTLMIGTYLYKENPLFRLAEHLMVGLSAGFSLTSSWTQWVVPTMKTHILAEGKYLYFIPVLFGLMIYFQYFPKLSWLARFPMSWYVGYGSGYVLALNPAPFMGQVINSFQRFTVLDKTGALKFGPTLNNVIFWCFLMSALSYFVFTISREKNKIVAYPAWLGRWVIMVALGAAFGNTVMARISLFIGRLTFLFRDWLHVVK